MYKLVIVLTLVGSLVAQNVQSSRHQKKIQRVQDEFQPIEASQPPKTDVNLLLNDPNFLAFFDEYQKRQQQIQPQEIVEQQPQTSTTPQPLVIPTIPQFQDHQFISTTRRPKIQAPQVAVEPRRTQRKRPTTEKPKILNNFQNFVAESRKTKHNPPQQQPQQLDARVNLNKFIQTPKQAQKTPKHHHQRPAVTPEVDLSKFDEAIFRKQAETAKYEFASESDDSISGSFHQRQEVRDGLAVKGAYSFSDGYYKRTVHYEADDKGFRIVREETEPIGDGPQYNPEGHAKVSQYVSGSVSNYQITNQDIQERPAITDFDEDAEQ